MKYGKKESGHEKMSPEGLAMLKNIYGNTNIAT